MGDDSKKKLLDAAMGQFRQFMGPRQLMDAGCLPENRHEMPTWWYYKVGPHQL